MAGVLLGVGVRLGVGTTGVGVRVHVGMPGGGGWVVAVAVLMGACVAVDVGRSSTLKA